MKFERFEIHAIPVLSEAFCECHERLQEVSNGFFSRALYCPKCENVYLIKMIKLPKKKITKEFLKQCREEIEVKRMRGEKIKAYIDKHK